MTQWIDFRELRAKLDFEAVLRHYGVEVKRKGDQHHGFCPLPGHNGKRNSPSFSANLKRGIFQCFGCGAKGNVLEFAAMMEKADPRDGQALHKIAMELQKQFCPGIVESPQQVTKAEVKKAESTTSVVVNAALDFTLKGLDPSHPYLYGRVFTPETISHFGLGYCSRGMLKGRIVIPLHDQAGSLIGYAGRVVDDSAITDENPRYRFPGSRARNGTCYEFRKTAFVYNGFRFKEQIPEIIVVEGFASVWWLTQHGYPHVVATMGSDCSEMQAELIGSLVKPDGRVWCIPDGDPAGERFAEAVVMQVSAHRFVRQVKLEQRKQPTDLSAEELKAHLSTATR